MSQYPEATELEVDLSLNQYLKKKHICESILVINGHYLYIVLLENIFCLRLGEKQINSMIN